ncbi:hypothetical protein DOY81_000770 [Sarcophaga bullata]|nr:hypothetical protein DOY81_000770 [Sarcophaga bullata]
MQRQRIAGSVLTFGEQLSELKKELKLSKIIIWLPILIKKEIK